MRRPRLSVQHCVVTQTTTRSGSPPTSNLLGVNHYLTVPTDAEFPRTVSTMDVFVRFFLRNPRTTKIAVEVWWLDANGADRMLVNSYVHNVRFGPNISVHDQVFRMVNVRLPGEGLYAVRVLRVRRPGPEPLPRVLLSADYFEVMR